MSTLNVNTINLVQTDSYSVAGDVTVTGNVISDGTTNSTSATTGAIQTDGGLGVVQDIWCGGGISTGGNEVLKIDIIGVGYNQNANATVTLTFNHGRGSNIRGVSAPVIVSASGADPNGGQIYTRSEAATSRMFGPTDGKITLVTSGAPASNTGTVYVVVFYV